MSKSVYQDIYADMQQAIEHGDYPYQSYLPSENELKELYGCSRTTVRRALELIDAGRLDVSSMVHAVARLEELPDILGKPELRALGKYIISPEK